MSRNQRRNAKKCMARAARVAAAPDEVDTAPNDTGRAPVRAAPPPTYSFFGNTPAPVRSDATAPVNLNAPASRPVSNAPGPVGNPPGPVSNAPALLATRQALLATRQALAVATRQPRRSRRVRTTAQRATSSTRTPRRSPWPLSKRARSALPRSTISARLIQRRCRPTKRARCAVRSPHSINV